MGITLAPVLAHTFLVMVDKVLYFTEGPGANGAVIGVIVAVLRLVPLQRSRGEEGLAAVLALVATLRLAV